jgi:hypothetical protein
MSLAPWPSSAETRALAALLCRPSPPLVAAPRLHEAGCVAALQARSRRPADAAQVARTFAALAAWRRAGGGLVTFFDTAYPDLLRQIARPPLALFLRGDAAALASPAVAIVGARAATPGACLWTQSTAGRSGALRCGGRERTGAWHRCGRASRGACGRRADRRGAGLRSGSLLSTGARRARGGASPHGVAS